MDKKLYASFKIVKEHLSSIFSDKVSYIKTTYGNEIKEKLPQSKF